jgi:DNA-binding winged helix-turn-helix (wHTH) protein/tetratricopeptide (TPR) repeat protein
VWLFPPFRLDVTNQTLWRDDTRLPLMPKPFAVLQYLVENAGRLVNQDELLAAIWPDTHVQPEILRRYILEIRRVLGDQAGAPQFIETVTKRGYRFIADVTIGECEPTLGAKIEPPKKSGRPRILIAVVATLICAVVVSGAILLFRHKPARLTEKDSIVLADFENTTGDATFDQTLRRGLAVQLEQSPFLSVVSEERIHEILRLMRLPQESKLTPEVASEVCQRGGATILIDGSIAQIGGKYNIILRAVNCASGQSLSRTEADANDRAHILQALGHASSDIRKRLGESLATIQKFDTPLVQATTASLEALQAYSLGYEQAVGNGDSGHAIPFLQRATKLDPNFAVAYSTLGLCYWNVGENMLASENIRKAYQLRESVSEWERFRVECEYHSVVTYNLEKARRAYEVWAQTYPRDWVPRNLLGVLCSALGQYDQALTGYNEALLRYPESGLISGNLVFTLTSLNRLQEAREIADRALIKHPDSAGLRVGLYRLAFLQNDAKTMQKQVEFSTGKAGLEDELLWNEAAKAAYFGQLQKSRALYRQAIASAERAEEREAAAGYEADAALKEALFGNKGAARQNIESALRLSTGPDVQYDAALALSLIGDVPRSDALSQNLARRFPEDTILQFIHLPTLKAQFALDRKNPLKAIEDLQIASAYRFGEMLNPVYVRGCSYLAAHLGAQAEAEFQTILDHPGIVVNSTIGALAHLEMGRALAMQGEVIKARTSYQDFLSLWKDADPDIPVLIEAGAEFAKLNRTRSRASS